jgi:hypothetical protein
MRYLMHKVRSVSHRDDRSISRHRTDESPAEGVAIASKSARVHGIAGHHRCIEDVV